MIARYYEEVLDQHFSKLADIHCVDKPQNSQSNHVLDQNSLNFSETSGPALRLGGGGEDMVLHEQRANDVCTAPFA